MFLWLPMAVVATGGVVHWSSPTPINPLTVIFGIMAAISSYLALANLLNRTRVDVDGATLTVRHGPIPWPGGNRWPIDEVEQLFVVEEVSGSGKGKDVRTYEYKVKARIRNGGDVLLVNGPLDPRRAKALEATLETFLRIPNERVEGELGS